MVVLYQKNNSQRIPDFLHSSLGFSNIHLIKNDDMHELTKETKIMISQVGLTPDSLLVVKNNNSTIVNVNDCEINDSDCKN